MRTNTSIRATLAVLPAAMLTLSSCSSTSEPPPPVGSGWFTPSKSGGVRVQTVEMTGTVTAIDKAKRKATLLASDGKTFVVKVSPKAVNFEQIALGDKITATVTQRIVESFAKEGDTSNKAAAAGTIQTTAKVIAIDAEKRTATLRFDDGEIETLPILDGLDLSQHKVGEEVVFRVTEMIAIWVGKPQ